MNQLDIFLQWLWARPTSKNAKVRVPIPRVFWHLLFYVLFLAIGYKTSRLFAPPSQVEKFKSLYHNNWMFACAATFFCAWITNDYLDKKYPSGKSGFFAQYSEGKRDFKDPIVKFYLFVGILSLITFLVGILQTWAKP
jgi:hypothetical protein